MTDSLANDIKEALVDSGASFVIKRGSTVIGVEYLVLSPNKQGTKPFTEEHLAEVQLCFDTAALTGDVVVLEKTGESYLLMSKNSELAENEVVFWNGILYKTNAVASFSRPGTDTRDPQTYKLTNTFASYATGVPVIVTDKMYGSIVDESQSIGDISIRSNEVMVSSSVGVQTKDRITFGSETYKVEQIETRRFAGTIWVCTVSEDTRGA